MGRIFRAFLWMRWRVLVNSLERTGARDTLERFSVAIGKLGPIMAMVLLDPVEHRPVRARHHRRLRHRHRVDR